MTETSNISRIGELAFGSIFSVFGWKKVGPYNESWNCLTKHKESSPKLGKHPTDAVYTYTDPYRTENVFVNIDFKSYGRSTLQNVDLATCARSLANTIECANKSQKYKELFLGDDDGEIIGLLFIYNHDGAYDPSRFRSAMAQLQDAAPHLAKDRRFAIVGPGDVTYLATVANSIERLSGSKTLKGYQCTFDVHNLIDRPACTQECLSIELLLGPWQLVKFAGVKDERAHSVVHMYYRANGTMAQFEYVLDFLFRYQVLRDNDVVHLNLPNAVSDAAVQLEHAKASFLSRYYNMPEIAAKLAQVKFAPIAQIQQKFSTIEIGMRNE